VMLASDSHARVTAIKRSTPRWGLLLSRSAFIRHPTESSCGSSGELPVKQTTKIRSGPCCLPDCLPDVLLCLPGAYPSLLQGLKKHRKCLILLGGRTRTRTWDPLIKSHMRHFRGLVRKSMKTTALLVNGLDRKRKITAQSVFWPLSWPCASRGGPISEYFYLG